MIIRSVDAEITLVYAAKANEPEPEVYYADHAVLKFPAQGENRAHHPRPVCVAAHPPLYANVQIEYHAGTGASGTGKPPYDSSD